MSPWNMMESWACRLCSCTRRPMNMRRILAAKGQTVLI